MTAEGTVRTDFSAHVAELEKACKWLGISIGRTSQYGTFIREFFEDKRRSDRHILAYNESCEIIDIYELWSTRVDDFPCIFEKIRSALLKGTFLQEEELSSASSNRPRNEAFTYLLAGRLLRGGLRVFSVDGIAMSGTANATKLDVGLDFRGQRIFIECKRPRTMQSLGKRINEAYGQFSQSNEARLGLVAIDCSVLVRESYTLLEAKSPTSAYSLVTRIIESNILPKVPKPLSGQILGRVLFARVPAMIRKERLRVLTPRGRRYTIFVPYSVSSWFIVPNRASTGKLRWEPLAAILSGQRPKA